MALILTVRSRTPRHPRSQQERLWLIGGSVAGFLLLLIGYFFLISPQRGDTSGLRSQMTLAQQENVTLQAKINSLREQKKNLVTYEAAYAQAQRALPSDSGISDFLRSLQALGNSTMTDVSQLTVSPPTPVTAALSAGTTAATAPTSTSTGPTSAPTAPPPGAVGAPTGQVFTMTITATVSGSPADLGMFLDQLQHVQPRAVLITQLTQTVGAAGSGTSAGGTSLQLTMQAFVAPADPAEAAALAAGGK